MSRIVLFGATGAAGTACLQQAVYHSKVKVVYVIARSEPSIQHKKIRYIQQSDFANYSQLVLEQCRGADAVIWCLGSNVSSMGTSETDYRVVTFQYTLAAARAFASLGQLRFVYLSCQSAAWYRAQKMTGRVKGDTERELAHMSGIDAVSLRAGNLSAPRAKTSPTRGLMRRLSSGIGKMSTIDVQEVGAVMVDIALHGPMQGKGGREEEGVYDNAEIKTEASRLGVDVA